MKNSFIRMLLVFMTLLVVQGLQAQTTYNNEDAVIKYPFNSKDYMSGFTSTPDGAFTVVTFDIGNCEYKKTITTTMCPDITFVDIKSTNGPADEVKWIVKPAKGLTFTPTDLSFYIARDGTDGSEKCVNVKGKITGSDDVITFKSITPHRNNKTQADDKWGGKDSYTIKFEYTLTAEQQAALKSGAGFELILNNGFDTNKACAYSDVQIKGKVDGTILPVQYFPVTAKAAPEEGGKVTLAPDLEKYEEESEVTLTATKNFGYKFVNWTDKDGKVVSENYIYKYSVAEAQEFTANFAPLATYELKYSVEGGANPYQVQAAPAPTDVDGKNMYEEGTKVTLTAISNPLVTFTNWSDGQSASEITVTMDADKELVATFSEIEYLAGWDFYLSGNNGRPADFASADNDAAALVLRDADGNTTGWLDKSQTGGGYEGRPGGVNWKTDGLGKWYWQTQVNAGEYSDIKVKGAFVYNYNAYTTQLVEASLDGENFETLGSVVLPGAKAWTDYEFPLPAAYNNQETVYIRWIADKNSEVKGTTSNNDGICIGATYIIGTEKIVDDGTAPRLLSCVPEESANDASANGKVVLNFDEKIKLAEGAAATLNGVKIEGTVSGKTVMFPYKNLEFGKECVFILPGGSVMDRCDNAIKAQITIHFTVRQRPEVAKAAYDFVVPDMGTFKEAIDAANKRDNKDKRFVIFVKKGTYELPWSETETVTNNGVTLPSPMTYLNASNTSIIGEDRDATVITNLMKDNTPVGTAYPIEGLHNVTTLYINKNVENTYIQDITLKNGLNDACGRGEAIEDNGNKTICKNVALRGYQDTYCSNNQNGRFYFEGGYFRGRTDYLCGKGDVFFNGVEFRQIKGGYLAVPSTPRKYGYILKDCVIVGENSDNKDDGKAEEVTGNYTLGRPWGNGTPIALYIDTKMNVIPSAVGWNEMSGGWPARFAEYNSMTANGTVIDLNGRKTTFGDNHANNPVLTKEEADQHTIANVMGDGDDWDPTLYTEQAPMPENVKLTDGVTLSWDDSQYASLWAICADGKVIAFTTEPSYSLSAPEAVAAQAAAPAEVVYSVRAANEMGGLGEAVEATAESAINEIAAEAPVAVEYYNLQGMRVNAGTQGLLIKKEILANGSTRTSKVIVK